MRSKEGVGWRELSSAEAAAAGSMGLQPGDAGGWGWLRGTLSCCTCDVAKPTGMQK